MGRGGTKVIGGISLRTMMDLQTIAIENDL
jgi:hypothetical protein